MSIIHNLVQKYSFLARNIFEEIFGNPVVINSYAWQSYDGSIEDSNWGDDINWYFLREVIDGSLISYDHAIVNKLFKRPNFIVIGSTIDLRANENSIIWGAGIIDSKTISLPKFKEIRAVRGPKTREKLLELGYDCPEIYGDPALLIPLHYKPNITKKYKLGIIPHFHDLENVKSEFDGVESVTVIDIRNYGKWTSFLDRILECDAIASSSLHGLIMSYAYNIPNVWIEFSKGEKRDRFKYDDFFQSIGKSEDPIYMEARTDITKIFDSLSKWQRGTIDLNPLLKSAPFKLKL